MLRITIGPTVHCKCHRNSCNLPNLPSILPTQTKYTKYMHAVNIGCDTLYGQLHRVYDWNSNSIASFTRVATCVVLCQHSAGKCQSSARMRCTPSILGDGLTILLPSHRRHWATNDIEKMMVIRPTTHLNARHALQTNSCTRLTWNHPTPTPLFPTHSHSRKRRLWSVGE